MVLYIFQLPAISGFLNIVPPSKKIGAVIITRKKLNCKDLKSPSKSDDKRA
jgi:hypothetical protein